MEQRDFSHGSSQSRFGPKQFGNRLVVQGRCRVRFAELEVRDLNRTVTLRACAAQIDFTVEQAPDVIDVSPSTYKQKAGLNAYQTALDWQANEVRTAIVDEHA